MSNLIIGKLRKLVKKKQEKVKDVKINNPISNEIKDNLLQQKV